MRLHHYAKDESGGGTASMSRTPRLPPPSLKPTIQQIFPPSERAPPNLGGLSTTLVCMKECDIEKFAADNLNLHSKGIFRKKVSGVCIKRPKRKNNQVMTSHGNNLIITLH